MQDEVAGDAGQVLEEGEVDRHRQDVLEAAAKLVEHMVGKAAGRIIVDLVEQVVSEAADEGKTRTCLRGLAITLLWMRRRLVGYWRQPRRSLSCVPAAYRRGVSKSSLVRGKKGVVWL